MNKLIIFPGNSPRNKSWGEEVAAEFGDLFDAVYMQHYDHWESGNESINFETEINKLNQEIKLSSPDTSFFIFAKSVGSLLSFLAVHQHIINPAKCVFFGLPLDLADKGIFKEDWSSLSNFPGPAIALHNNNDPTANYDFAKKSINQYAQNTITFIELAGNDHSYNEYNTYRPIIKNFLNLSK